MAGEYAIAAGATPGTRKTHYSVGWENDREPWMDQGACVTWRVSPELFFPDERKDDEAAAKDVWASCDVKEQCLEYAKARDERYGIWGGLNPRERRAGKRPPGAPVVVAVKRKMTRLGAEDVAEVAELRARGVTVPKIAELFGCADTTIYRVLQRLGADS